jgi:hypothetical protein
LNVDDRIILHLSTDDTELNRAVKEYIDDIKAETLTTDLSEAEFDFTQTLKVEGVELKISLKKA